ncbi:MAG: acyltransferase family protein [Rhodopseudomonas palustris]|uniref:Acyltransferase family protein n=1 Tax=Rhodopseudomonas palustris TaxID=1076 RepID=A0A933S2M0_RHOPL|nr:acyltransferase family protein [Rhodopseudomonas palustris]
MTTSAPPSAKAERLHALDAVRGFALLLGIFYHAAISFLPFAPQIWIVADNHPSETLSIFVFASHSFRMTTFFLIAGFFAHLSYHRLGAAGFIRDRARRIALPLVVGWPIVTLAFGVIVATSALVANQGRLPSPPAPSAVVSQLSLAHLWFLYVLLELYAVTLLLRAVMAAVDRTGRVEAGIDRIMTTVASSRLAPFALALPAAAALLADPDWTTWPNIRTPEHLITNLQAWVAYGVAFGFGFLLHRQPRLIWSLQPRWPLNMALAIVSIAACFGLMDVSSGVDANLLRLARALCYAIAGWSATLAIIGAALRFLSGASATRRYIADASYWLYIVHMPIVIALQLALARLDWPWPAKYAAIVSITLAIGFVSYQTLVRYGRIGAVLNGPRSRQKQTPQHVARAEPV